MDSFSVTVCAYQAKLAVLALASGDQTGMEAAYRCSAIAQWSFEIILHKWWLVRVESACASIEAFQVLKFPHLRWISIFKTILARNALRNIFQSALTQ